MEDEQVLVCRQMKPILEIITQRAEGRPPLVLDVGTGSGVFAIYAVRHGCRAIGVDILPRAIRMSRHNASNPRNRVKSAASRQELDDAVEPLVLFTQQDFLEFADAGCNTEAFDAVVINPPYNPTCPGVLAAVHADAGRDGFAKFKEWVEVIPRLLKPGGYCIGIQMSPVDSDGDIRAVEHLRKAFGTACDIRYRRVFQGGDLQSPETMKQLKAALLPEEVAPDIPSSGVRAGNADDISALTFLCLEYKTCLNNAPGQSDAPVPTEVAKYIWETSLAVENFAVLYFHLQKPSDKVPPNLPAVAELRTWQWADRIQMHRHIIENSDTDCMLPAPALFIEHAAVPNVRLDRENAWKRSPLCVLDVWLNDRDLLSSQAVPCFDVFLAGSGPWYELGTEETMPDLQREIKFWVSQTDPRQGENNSRLLKDLVDDYDPIEKTIQKAHIIPFLHPRYTGRDRPQTWQSLIYTEIGLEWSAEGMSAEWHEVAGLRDRLMAGLEPDECSTDRSSSGQRDGHRDDDDYPPGYSREPLSDTDIRRSDAQDYAENVETRVQQLEEQWKQERQNDPLPDFMRMDLAACAWVVHHLLHRDINQRMRQHGRRELEWSTLLCLPLTLVHWARGEDERPVPKEFRGSVYLLSGSTDRWTPSHEQALLDALAILSLLYNGKYNLEAEEYLLKEGGRRAAAEELSEYARGAAHGFKNALASPPLFLQNHLDTAESTIDVYGSTDPTHTLPLLAATARDMKVTMSLLEQLQLQAQLFFWVMASERFEEEKDHPRQQRRWPLVPVEAMAATTLARALSLVYNSTPCPAFAGRIAKPDHLQDLGRKAAETAYLLGQQARRSHDEWYAQDLTAQARELRQELAPVFQHCTPTTDAASRVAKYEKAFPTLACGRRFDAQMADWADAEAGRICQDIVASLIETRPTINASEWRNALEHHARPVVRDLIQEAMGDVRPTGHERERTIASLADVLVDAVLSERPDLGGRISSDEVREVLTQGLQDAQTRDDCDDKLATILARRIQAARKRLAQRHTAETTDEPRGDRLRRAALLDGFNLEFRCSLDENETASSMVSGVLRGVLEGVLLELAQNAVRAALDCAVASSPRVGVDIYAQDDEVVVSLTNTALVKSARMLKEGIGQGGTQLGSRHGHRASGGIRGLRQVYALADQLFESDSIAFDSPEFRGDIAKMSDEDTTEVTWKIRIAQMQSTDVARDG